MLGTRASPHKGVTGTIRALSLLTVDTFTTTWMILMQALWLQLRFSTMMKRLANWFAVFIRLSQKWCERIDRGALLKRIFAK